jgi:hypothetical protein
VVSARRKCLFLCFYFMDRDFGLIHVKMQTWFPLQIKVYVNGHEWLARKLQQNGIRYAKRENIPATITPDNAEGFTNPLSTPQKSPSRTSGLMVCSCPAQVRFDGYSGVAKRSAVRTSEACHSIDLVFTAA